MATFLWLKVTLISANLNIATIIICVRLRCKMQTLCVQM